MDYTDPQKPVLIQWLDMPGNILSVHYAGGRVYVAAARGGVWIPNQP